MENPMISIVMAVYNAAPYLSQCLDSIFGQTYDNWELIAVEDGSTDDSLSILNQYGKVQEKMTICAQKNQGAGCARNHGMAQAKGKYLLFLDADDYFEPNLLEKLVETAESTEATVTICRSQCFDHETGQLLPSEWLRKDQFLSGKTSFSPEEMRSSLLQFTYGWAWDKLFLREFIMEKQLEFPSLRNSEDLVFVYPALVSAERISVVADVLVHYRMKRKDSVSHSRFQAQFAPWTAMDLFHDYLKNHGLYQRYEQTFLNWVMEFLVWNIANMPCGTVQKQEFYRVKRELIPQYDLGKHPKSYYGNQGTYWKYLLVKYGTYGAFAFVVTGYHRWKRTVCQ